MGHIWVKKATLISKITYCQKHTLLADVLSSNIHLPMTYWRQLAAKSWAFNCHFHNLLQPPPLRGLTRMYYPYYPNWANLILHTIQVKFPNSQEDEGAPIYWSRAPIYWSPWILFSKFWEGLRRESSDKTRFCVSHDGPTNELETFCLPCFMFKNKTKNMFVEPKGLQYNGA